MAHLRHIQPRDTCLIIVTTRYTRSPQRCKRSRLQSHRRIRDGWLIGDNAFTEAGDVMRQLLKRLVAHATDIGGHHA